MLVKAKNIIYQSIHPLGLLASAHQVDNYARVWSRDACMTGMTGLFLGDAIIIDAFKQSVLTLATFQSPQGQIPSNVSQEQKVSYGTLVGRVDATTWWLVAVCTLLRRDSRFFNEKSDFLLPKIEKALSVLDVWEMNARHLIYTPLGGNWADEYVSSGYTLYDNCLRYWALKQAALLLNSESLIAKADAVAIIIQQNYGHQLAIEKPYHPEAYARKMKDPKPYMSSAFSANGFDQRWDMAGNALAMLLGLHTQVEQTVAFLQALQYQFVDGLLPVFYPIIKEQDRDWFLLQNNFLYHFKNEPYRFHNGGAWPIFWGWLSAGLKQNNQHVFAADILKTYENKLSIDADFQEFYATDTGVAMGTSQLCFSASGYLLMTLDKIELW